MQSSDIKNRAILKQLWVATIVLLSLWGCKTQDNAALMHMEKPQVKMNYQEPDPGSIFMYPERILLEDGDFCIAERGVIFVPTNRSKADSKVMSLEIYRFRAKNKAHSSRPPIFFLAGGPSFEGLESRLAEKGYFERRWEALTDIADVVVISQRGIGPSKPTTLIDNSVIQQAPDQSFSHEKRVKQYQTLLHKEKAAMEAMDIDLNAYTVLEAAEDVNDVRRAFSYGKITIWGGSFGSHWGMTFMHKYPELVERAVMRGMEGPDHTYDHPGHIWNVYERVAADAENSPELHIHIPEGGLVNALRVAIKKASDNPTIIKVGDQDVLIDGQVIRSYARGYGRNLNSWPACIIDMYNGNYDKIAKRIAKNYLNAHKRFRTASYWMLDCGSGITPERLAEHEADPAVEFLPHIAWNYKAGCGLWGSDLGDAFRQNFETEIPTVIIQGTWDTSTPYENAVELAPYFKNSKFVTVIRGHHGTINQASQLSEPFKNALHKFAATGDFSELQDTVVVPIPEWQMPIEK